MAFTLPALPYPPESLEPHIDKQTMEIHHDKHHNAYVTNLNAAIEKAPELASKSLDDLVKGISSVPEGLNFSLLCRHGTQVWFSRNGDGLGPTRLI